MDSLNQSIMNMTIKHLDGHRSGLDTAVRRKCGPMGSVEAGWLGTSAQTSEVAVNQISQIRIFIKNAIFHRLNLNA